MRHSSITLYDRSGMQRLLETFPEQVEDAVRIGKSARLPRKTARLNTVVITGLGGSAIGGDLLRSYLAGETAVPFFVNRQYSLPEFVGPRTLVVVSSYSGNTEETVAAHKDATRRGAKVLCISSGGMTRELAARNGQPFIRIPGGLPPRAALGYSFFPLLMAFSKMKLIAPREKDIRETILLLRKKAKAYSSPGGRNNHALALARKLYLKLPIIYSSADRFDAVNLRWRGQMAENAKMLAFGHVLPEMNHNELVGWKVLGRLMEEMVVIILRDKDDHRRVQLRMDLTADILRQYAAHVIQVKSEGRSLLARMFSLVALGDWVSFYLAILNGVDPTPVRIIDYLKSELGSVP